MLLEQLRAVCGVVVDDEMNWRYSDRAEQPAEAAEALPSFDATLLDSYASLVRGGKRSCGARRGAAGDYVVAHALRDERAPSTTSPCTTARGDGGCSARARGGSCNFLLLEALAGHERVAQNPLGLCPVPIHWRAGPPFITIRTTRSCRWRAVGARVGGGVGGVGTNVPRNKKAVARHAGHRASRAAGQIFSAPMIGPGSRPSRGA